MGAYAAPYGLIAVENLIDGSTNFSIKRIAMTADINRKLAVNDIINVGAGALGIQSATPTTTRNGNSPWGIVRGITVKKAPGGSFFTAVNYLPANAVTAGYEGIVLEVIISPFIIMKVQASANTGASTAIGKNAALVMTEASATNGSQIALDASTIATTNTLAVKIIGFADQVNGASETYPDYLVTWNQNVHPLANILGV